MPRISGVEQLSLLPNRFALTEFSQTEAGIIIGGDFEQHEFLRDNFNWIGAYLVEQAGLHEHELTDWFRSEARGLEGERPLDVWRREDGFDQVFAYAKRYKQQADEALADEPATAVETYPWTKSHEIANVALAYILKGFESAGVVLDPQAARPHTASQTIHNPENDDALTIRWKGNGQLEDYHITLREGERSSMYYVVRFVGNDDEPPLVLQTGVVDSYKDEMLDGASDSDINGRAPSYGEVAKFMIPLALETKRRTLQPMHA